MDFRSKTSRTLLLAAVLSMAAAGCGKHNGDEAGAGSGAGTAGSGAATTTSGATGTTGSGSSGNGTAATAGLAIDDSIITTKLKTALLADTTLKGSDISVETRNGEVSLTGTVSSPAQKDHAVKIAQSLNGVKNVNNLLALKK